MLEAERKDKILTILETRNYLSIAELCDMLHFSESTIRRDIKKLEHSHLVTQTRGGLIRNMEAASLETPIRQRQSTNLEIKRVIAAEAAKRVQDNQTLMFDASTTVMEMIPFLKTKKNLTIITFCLPTAIRVTEELNCKLICTGGKYHSSTASFLGLNAIEFLKNWYADIMFFSCSSIDPEKGLTDQGDEIAQIKVEMRNQSRDAIFLADASKYGHTSFFRLNITHFSEMIVESSPILDASLWSDYRKLMTVVQR